MSASRSLLPLLGIVCLLSACTVRSISNPGRPWGSGNTTYAGEISDFDVVGTGTFEVAEAGGATLRPGQRVLVVQSGAGFPDEAMLQGLGAHFEVGTASGIPTGALGGEHGMLAAAQRGGFDAVVAYWGILESRERPTEGVAASWVPIVGMFVPDSSQQMRIRLRIVVADARTGRWRCLLPEPIDDERASSLVTRRSEDAEQVEVLKDAAYRVAVQSLVALAQR